MRLARFTLAAALLAGGLGLGSVQAGELSPSGLWEASDKSSRYLVTMCGDGTQLCAKLTYLKDGEMAQLDGRVNDFVVYKAKRTADTEWRATVRVSENDVDGHVRLVSSTRMQVTGCIGALCQSMTLKRLR